MNAPDAPFEPSLKRILIVDDEEIVRIALRETLRRDFVQFDDAFREKLRFGAGDQRPLVALEDVAVEFDSA